MPGRSEEPRGHEDTRREEFIALPSEEADSEGAGCLGMVFCFFLSQWGECQGRNRKDRNFKILYIWAHFREPLSSTAWGSGFPSGSSNRGHFSTGGSPPASQRCLTVASATFTKCVPGSHHPRRRRGEGSAASKHRCTAQLPLHAALGPLQTPWLSCPLAGVSQEDGPFPRVTLTGHSSGAQFTGSLCSLLCWGLLLNSSSLDPPWGGLLLPWISGFQTWSRWHHFQSVCPKHCN